MYDLIIIGGGPAALAAASFALSKQLNLCMIYDKLGGWTGAHQLLVGQMGKEHLAGEEAIEVFERELSQSGITIHDRVVNVTRAEESFEIVTQNHGVLQAVALLVATGARPIMLDVPGAAEFLGQGLGYSATTHAQITAGKAVAVIGTTERALRGVIELADHAAQVYIIGDDLDELETPLAQVVRQLPNVEILEGYTVKEITGGFNVEEIVLLRGAETRRLAVDAAFIDLGLVANSEVVRGLVQTDNNGFIKVDDRKATAVAGLFAAGDVTTAVGEQKLIAVGEGARAAWTAYGYILARRTTRRLAEAGR